MRVAKALASLRICADSPEPLFLADAMSTIPTHVGPITDGVSLLFFYFEQPGSDRIESKN